MNSNRFFLMGILTVFLLVFACGLCYGTNTFYHISGEAYSQETYGSREPVNNMGINIYKDNLFYGTVYTQSDGTWSYSPVYLGENVQIIPYYLIEFGVQQTDPNMYSYFVVGDFEEVNFDVSPRVWSMVVTNLYPPIDGSDVRVIVDGDLVSTSDEHSVWSFFPNDFSLPYQGCLDFEKAFHVFSGQAEGNFDTYDCRNRVSARPQGANQYINFNPDVVSINSWEDPGGLGWTYFPKTPDNRVDNNPNFLAKVQFQFPNLGSNWPKDSIRIHGISTASQPNMNLYSNVDLTTTNGFLAEFEQPLGDCWQGNFKIQVLIGHGSFGETWDDLTPDWLTSISNVDLNGDGFINLGDVGELSSLWGKCIGEEGYNPCANFFPDVNGCINLSEIGVFNSVYYMNTNKSETKIETNSDIFISVTPCESEASSDCLELKVSSPKPWDVALIPIEIDSFETNPLQWSPSLLFDGKSILLDDPAVANRQNLYLIGPLPAGTTLAGVIQNRSEKSRMEISIGKAVAVNSKIDNTKTAPPLTQIEVICSPNPFNSQTTIAFNLPNQEAVKIQIFDLAGCLVKVLLSGENFSQGRHEAVWNGRDDGGRRVASGTYFYRLEAGAYGETKRVVLIK